MRTLIDFDAAPVFAIPTSDGSDGLREGMLLEGPQGWGEFSPPPDRDRRETARWLTAAIEPGTVGWPDAVRGRVPVAVAVPTVAPLRAREIVNGSGCRSADVMVGRSTLADDVARLEAVRDALGPRGAIRLNVGGRWATEEAIAVIPTLARAAGGLEFVDQPCNSLADLATVRRRSDVRIAVRPSRHLADPLLTRFAEAADVAVLACSALGGVRRGLRVAETYGQTYGLPCVVSSEMETSVGLAAGLALAGALPELPLDCGLGTASLLGGDVVADARVLLTTDGYLPVAPMPPAPDPRLVERHAITDPARIAWWRDRLRAQFE